MRQLKAFINKDVLKRMRHNNRFEKMKSPNLFMMKEGDICVTNEKNTMNIYIVVNPKLITYIDLSDEELVMIQDNGVQANYMPLSDYEDDDDIELHNIGDSDFDIKYVFHTSYRTEDVLTKENLYKVLNEAYKEICKRYPKEAKNIYLK